MAFVFSTFISIGGLILCFLTAELQFNRPNINTKVQNIIANLSYAFRTFIEFLMICRHHEDKESSLKNRILLYRFIVYKGIIKP